MREALIIAGCILIVLFWLPISFYESLKRRWLALVIVAIVIVVAALIAHSVYGPGTTVPKYSSDPHESSGR